MKLNDIDICDSTCICGLGDGEGYNSKVCLVADATLNKNFECLQVFTNTDEYILSLVEETIEDQNSIPEDIMIEVNKIIENYGGKEKIINTIQDLYNKNMKSEKSLGYDISYYKDFGKDNIKSYCII